MQHVDHAGGSARKLGEQGLAVIVLAPLGMDRTDIGAAHLARQDQACRNTVLREKPLLLFIIIA